MALAHSASWPFRVTVGVLALLAVLTTIAGAAAYTPYYLVLSNPYPAETAAYRAMSPYTTPYMTTGYSPLGTTGYAPSYGWTSQYTAVSYRPAPMDHFGVRVVSPYDTAMVYGRKVDEPLYRGAYTGYYGGVYYNQLSHTRQAPLLPGDSRLAAPATHYPTPSIVQSEWS